MISPELLADLEARDADGLREYAKANDIKVTLLPNVRAETLLKQITAALDGLPPVDDAAEPEAAADPEVPAADPQAPAEVDDAAEPEAPTTDIVTMDDGSNIERDPANEAVADAIIADLALSHIAMSHPDGGTSDRYEVDSEGNILVPVEEAAVMFNHGFVVA